MDLYEEVREYDNHIRYKAKVKALLFFCIAVGCMIALFALICLIVKGYGG